MNDDIFDFSITPPDPSPHEFMQKIMDSITKPMGLDSLPEFFEHPIDTFDRMTKDGYRLNLITGAYTSNPQKSTPAI